MPLQRSNTYKGPDGREERRKANWRVERRPEKTGEAEGEVGKESRARQEQGGRRVQAPRGPQTMAGPGLYPKDDGPSSDMFKAEWHDRSDLSAF